MASVQPICDGDARIAVLVERLQRIVEESRNVGLTAAAVVGAIEVVKHDLLREVLES